MSRASRATLAWRPSNQDPGSVRDGLLSAPTSWTAAGKGTQVALPVRQWLGEPNSETVVLLAGGPGESGIEEASHGTHRRLLDRLLPGAHVLAFDQRGTGASEPSLRPNAPWGLPLGASLTHTEALERARRTCQVSARRWQANQVDPNWFTMAESVHDLHALIESLGSAPVALFGQSFGTQLGLAYVRSFGDHVSRCVFVNVEGPDQTVKLPSRTDLALEVLLHDEHVGEGTETPFEILQGLLEQASVRPLIANHGRTTIAIGSFELQRVVCRCLGQRRPLETLIKALRDASRDDRRGLAGLVAEWKTSTFAGLQLVVDSASGISRARRERFDVERETAILGDAMDFPLPFVADELGIYELDDSYRAPIHSDVPTLFISGGRDARTPAANVDDILGTFAHARHVIHPTGMHSTDDYLSDAPIQNEVMDWLGG